MILALDPATITGWATPSASGTWDLSVRRDESSGMRLIRLRSKLNEIHKAMSLRIVVFEAHRHAIARASGATVQSEFQGVIKVWCEDNHVEYRGYSPKEVKKHATGNGNANKDEMFAAAQLKWPRCNDHNEADALHLLDLAMKEYA